MGIRGAQQTLGICLVFRLILCVLTNPIYDDQQLYEGSPCTLANGEGSGVCVRFEKCPSKMQELKERRYDQADRCSFENFTEIVCCQTFNITEKLSGVSPAETACHEYENEILETGKSVSFLILGGVDAESNEFPHMAALGYVTRSNDDETSAGADMKYNCGGTLISRQHVLTAAHCVNNVNEAVPVEVRLGSTDLTEVGESTQRMSIESITSHPDYKRSRNYNDLAIIKLREPIRLTNSVQPACLLTKSVKSVSSNRENQTLVVLGWGVTEFAGENSNKLKKAVGLRLVDQNECSARYENRPKLPEGLDNRMFCAIDMNSTRKADTCQGDSGGPILLCSGTARPFVAGVTAFGEACGGSTPSVYTSISGYLNWIEEQVWPISNTNSNSNSNSNSNNIRRPSRTIDFRYKTED